MWVEMENMLKKEDMNVLFTQRFIFTQKSRILTQLEEFKKGNLIWYSQLHALGLKPLEKRYRKMKNTVSLKEEALKTTSWYFDSKNRFGSIWFSK